MIILFFFLLNFKVAGNVHFSTTHKIKFKRKFYRLIQASFFIMLWYPLYLFIPHLFWYHIISPINKHSGPFFLRYQVHYERSTGNRIQLRRTQQVIMQMGSALIDPKDEQLLVRQQHHLLVLLLVARKSLRKRSLYPYQGGFGKEYPICKQHIQVHCKSNLILPLI